MSAPEPPVGSIVRTAKGHAVEHTEDGWRFAGSRDTHLWESLQWVCAPLTTLYTPPTPPTPTLVDRMAKAFITAPGDDVPTGMRAALAVVVERVAAEPHPGMSAEWDEATCLRTNCKATTYRNALLAALRAEAGAS